MNHDNAKVEIVKIRTYMHGCKRNKNNPLVKWGRYYINQSRRKSKVKKDILSTTEKIVA